MIGRASGPRPIRSAFTLAALRAASAKEPDPEIANPDVFARHYAAPVHQLLLKLPHFVTRRLVERISPGSYAFFLARTRFVDRCLERAVGGGARQVVLLGAGCDSRALRFAGILQGATVFEVDLPATQAEKRARLASLGLEAPVNVRYLPLDLNETRLAGALQRAGFDPRTKTFFIWEGVSYYLAEPKVREVLDFVGRGCLGGSTIVFDYALRSFVDGDDTTYGGRQIQRWLRRNGEFFLFGLPPEVAADFLREHGLVLLEDLGPAEITSSFLTRANGECVGRPLEHLRLACARSLEPMPCS